MKQMSEPNFQHALPAMFTDAKGVTVWTDRTWPEEIRGGMLLSPRIDCSSLRLRKSEPGYRTGWHVAGDATLIIVRCGQMKLILRDGSERTFGPGEAFIAADDVPDGQEFDTERHGHRVEVVGDETLEAIHIKLSASAS
jgi:hypothetical protein